MRRIKFRAWHKSNKSMCQNVTTDLLGRDYLEFMQYTELKDIYGKDIYEGDILNISKEYSGNFVPVYVLFEEGAFKVQLVHRMLPPFNLYEKVSLYEVIGNIYENPELMDY